MPGKIGDFPDGFTYREGRKEVLVFPGKSESLSLILINGLVVLTL